MSDELHWPKPKELEKHTDEDGNTYFTVDTTPHPSIIEMYANANASDFNPKHVDQCIRIYYLTHMCGLPLDEARKLAEHTHTLHIDEESDDDSYILTLVSKEEE